MNFKALSLAVVMAGSLAATHASADTVFTQTGPSSENFTLYGLGGGAFSVGQGTSVYDAGTNTTTATLSGAITGGSTGYGSGNYSFITTFAGPDNNPVPGGESPLAETNPSNTNEFFYSFLYPSTTMTLDLFGTPTGDHVIPLVVGGAFVDGTGFSFQFVANPTCTGVDPCSQASVGLTLGSTISGPVTISASFMTAAVPEPSTWAMRVLGFLGVGFMAYRRSAPHAALNAA